MNVKQHVVRRASGWAVIGEGNSRDTSIHPTRREAIERGRQIAKNQRSKLVIHGLNGNIRETKRYGADPFPPRGLDLVFAMANRVGNHTAGTRYLNGTR
jgi:hypothetical protein